MSDLRPLTFRDFIQVERLSSAAVSPDGRRLAFVAARHDPAENKVSRTIRQVDLATGEEAELTPGPGNHGAPAFSPDGRWLAFTSTRDPDQGNQLWLLPTGGGEARRVTSGPGGVGTPVWAPDSRRIAFTRSVVVSARLGADARPDPKKGYDHAQVYGLVNKKSSARVEDDLLFRHWDAWRGRQRSHAFVVDVESGACADVTPGDRDTPPISLGSACDLAWSPDGRLLAFAANPDRMVALSTNNCVFVLEIEGTEARGEPRRLGEGDGCDSHPRFAPDGRAIWFLSMPRPRHESDRNRLVAVDLETGAERRYLEGFDRSPSEFAFHAGAVLLVAQDRGRQSVYRLDPASGEVRQLTCGTWNGGLVPIPGSADFVVGRQSVREPQDLFRVTPGEGIAPLLTGGPLPEDVPADAGASAVRLTRAREALGGVDMQPATEVWYPAADGTLLHGFLVRPPGMAEGARVPLVLLIHGGPQGAFADDFHWRWNAQLFAARGTCVALLNPRGSTGYGQKLTDEISGDWGGRCMDDLMRGLDHILATFPFLDPDRVVAAGASFGGYMVNWILGHSDRFKALVSHDGIFVLENMAWTTEELWFPWVEFRGLPHENRELYERWSPHRHAAAFRTPTLVVQGEQDFRCPTSEGLGLFTALQVMGVPSRLLWFPDEGHWVMQPANAEVWYHEVVGWLMEHV